MRTRTTIALISASFALWTLIFALGLGLNFRPVKPNLVAVVLIQVGVSKASLHSSPLVSFPSPSVPPPPSPQAQPTHLIPHQNLQIQTQTTNSSNIHIPVGDFLTVITAVLLGAWINWKDERPLAGAGESAAGGKGGAGGVV